MNLRDATKSLRQGTAQYPLHIMRAVAGLVQKSTLITDVEHGQVANGVYETNVEVDIDFDELSNVVQSRLLRYERTPENRRRVEQRAYETFFRSYFRLIVRAVLLGARMKSYRRQFGDPRPPNLGPGDRFSITIGSSDDDIPFIGNSFVQVFRNLTEATNDVLDTITAQQVGYVGRDDDKVISIGGMRIKFTHMPQPGGGGKGNRIPVTSIQDLRRKKSVYFPEANGHCLTRAIMMCLFNGGSKAYKKSDFIKYIEDSYQSFERQHLQTYHDDQYEFTIDDVKLYENSLTSRIVVFQLREGNSILYAGNTNYQSRTIYLSLVDRHFCSILSPAAYFGTDYFCSLCLRGCSHIKTHKCSVCPA